MQKNRRRGFTLIESLVSIVLLSALLGSMLGAFFISSLSTTRARHKYAAMNFLKTYLEQEIRAGYDGGVGGEGDYYATVSSADPVSITIDDMGTADTADDIIGVIEPDPYYPSNVEDAGGALLAFDGIPYKIAGFVVMWTVSGRTYSERAATYIVYHSTT